MEAATTGDPAKTREQPITFDQPETSVTRSANTSVDIQLSPPDDRYGWVVVGASFMAHMIGDGCCFSFGVVFTELLDFFDQGRSKTAWVGSLFVSMPMICGPIASSFTNRFGCRKTTIVGGIIAAVGCFASAFVDSIEMLCLTFGLISGFGLALVFVPTIVVVAFYFEKQRAFATGIAVAGSGIGTFVFAPLTDFLVDKYSWQGAFVILSGVLLNLIVCGALFRPLVLPKKSANRSSKSVTKSTEHEHPDSNISISRLDRNNLIREPQFVFKTYLDNGHCLYYETATNSVFEFPTYLQEEFDSIVVLLTADSKHEGRTLREALAERNLLHKFQVSNGTIPTRETIAVTDLNHEECTEKGGTVDEASAPGSVSCPPSPPMPLLITHPASTSFVPPSGSSLNQESRNTRHIPSLQSPRSKDSRQDRFRVTCRKDVFYRGSLLRTGFMVNSEYSASCPDLYLNGGKRRETKARAKSSTWNEFRHSLRRMMDLSIFRSVIFDFFCLHCFFLYLTYDVPYLYVPDEATISSAATDTEASFLIAIIGISSTVGQLVMGYLGDRPEINTLHFYNAMTSVAGIVTLFVPLLKSFPLLAVYCAAYGFFISANYVLTTIILVDLLGMDRLTNAFGIVSLSEGLGNLIGPPLAGLLYDATGSYGVTFYVAGAIIWMSGSMLFIVPCLQRLEPQPAQSSHSSPDALQSSAASTTITVKPDPPTGSYPNGEVCKAASLSAISANMSDPNVNTDQISVPSVNTDQISVPNVNTDQISAPNVNTVQISVPA